MTSWVHVFSKFTPEALLFEALLISFLLAGYAVFWVLRKRRLGSVDSVVPTGVVKSYLNELILDAERMRAQLFGLLANAEGGKIQNYAPLQIQAIQNIASGGAAADPEALQRLSELESQMTQQSSALESVMAEKARLEADLAAARAAGVKSSAGDGDSAVVTELQNKLKVLENKLAEYSVIEDDLANLKRLQQENAQLRAALNGQGVAPPAAQSIPEPVAPVAPEPTPAPAASASPLDSLTGTIDQNSIDALFAADPAPAPVAAETPKAAPDAMFEGLVDQVEKSLQPEAPAPKAAAKPARPSTSSAPAATIDRSDADLVAEFEKMLNG